MANGAITATSFTTKKTSDKVMASHDTALATAITKLQGYAANVDNCGNCTASNCSQNCTTNKCTKGNCNNCSTYDCTQCKNCAECINCTNCTQCSQCNCDCSSDCSQSH